MGGTAPKGTVIPAGVLSLLTGVGLRGAGCDGLVLAHSLSFQPVPACSSKEVNLHALPSRKHGE